MGNTFANFIHICKHRFVISYVQHDLQQQVKKANNVLEFTFQSRWNRDCLASSLFYYKLLQYMVENTVYIGDQLGTTVILSWYQTAMLDRLSSKFMKVQVRIKELCHV